METDSTTDRYSQWFAFSLTDKEGICDCRNWQRNPLHRQWIEYLNQGLWD